MGGIRKSCKRVGKHSILNPSIMKATINFILVAFLFLLGSSKTDVSSTIKLNDNMLISEPTHWQKVIKDTWTMEFPVWCGNEASDYLIGTADIHITERIENGKPAWMIMTISGSFVGNNAGEVYKYKEIDKVNIPVAGDNTFHINVKGNMGSHFIMSGSYLSVEPWVIFDKAICY